MPQPERLNAEAEEELVPVIDWDAVAASVRIEISPDGSVTVVGIPNSMPMEYGQIIARVATAAALKHWRRTEKSRPTPSRDDRRLFTKAAKKAVRELARRSQQAALPPRERLNGPAAPTSGGGGATGVFHQFVGASSAAHNRWT